MELRNFITFDSLIIIIYECDVEEGSLNYQGVGRGVDITCIKMIYSGQAKLSFQHIVLMRQVLL